MRELDGPRRGSPRPGGAPLSRGHDRERRVRDWLLERDWVVVRAAGSLGEIDLVALKAGETPRLVEVKSTAGGPYERFGPAERADLQQRAQWAGAAAWLAWWPPRGQLRWIPSHEWPVLKARADIRLATPKGAA